MSIINISEIFQFMFQDNILKWILLVISLIVIYYLYLFLKEPKAVLIGFILFINLMFMALTSLTFGGSSMIKSYAISNNYSWLVWILNNSIYVYLISLLLVLTILRYGWFWNTMRKILRF